MKRGLKLHPIPIVISVVLIIALPLFIWAVLYTQIVARRSQRPNKNEVKSAMTEVAVPKLQIPPTPTLIPTPLPTLPTGCYYQMVVCAVYPCPPILVCPTGPTEKSTHSPSSGQANKQIYK